MRNIIQQIIDHYEMVIQKISGNKYWREILINNHVSGGICKYLNYLWTEGKLSYDLFFELSLKINLLVANFKNSFGAYLAPTPSRATSKEEAIKRLQIRVDALKTLL